MTTQFKTMLAGVVGLGLLASSAAPSRADSFYDGKTVTVIVSAAAGGGISQSARILIRVMAKRLGKDTNMLIKHMPGAGGLVALNFFAHRVEPNGLTLYYGNQNAIPVLLKRQGVRFDPKHMTMIGALPVTFITVARTDIGDGVRDRAHFVDSQGIVVGGRGGSTSSLDILSLLPLDILGMKYRYVRGYRGQAKMALAIKSGEINFVTTGQPGYQMFYKGEFLKKGEGIALFYHGPFDHKGEPVGVKDYPPAIPNFYDYYRKVRGKIPSGPAWDAYRWNQTFNLYAFAMMARRGMPAERVEALRAAYKATMDDSKFINSWTKQFGIPPSAPLVGENAEYLLDDFRHIPAGALEVFRHLGR